MGATSRELRTPSLAIFSFRASQSQRSEGVTPHISYWSSPLETGEPGQSGVVDGLEDLDVELSSIGRVERHAKSEEGVSESTNTKTNGTVAEVALASLRDRVVVDLDNLVQVLGDNLNNLVKLLEVELLLAHVYEGGKSEGSQVADGDLIRSSVLDNLSTQVGAANDTEVLLVTLAVASILVQHEGVTSLGLSFENGVPQLLSADGVATTAFALVFLVQSLELVAVNVGQTRTFRGAHQGPGGVLLDTLHEEIGNPKSVEEIASTDFLLTVVLAKVEEGEDIGVPGLEVDGEGTRTLVAALVDISGSVVENTEHGYETVGCAVGTSNVRASLEGVVDAINRIVLHVDQEARSKLGLRGSGTEEGG
ncbi:hypothetical protein KCU93_g71, partial [Aureobasidium melanogenum]